MIDLPPTLTERPVTIYVYEASEVALSANETVRLDELVPNEESGFEIERYGDLIEPGEHRLGLVPGVYHFRLVGDATLQIDPDAVVVVSFDAGERSKEDWPTPPPPLPPNGKFPSPGTVELSLHTWSNHMEAFAPRGEACPRGRPPSLTVVERRRR